MLTLRMVVVDLWQFLKTELVGSTAAVEKTREFTPGPLVWSIEQSALAAAPATHTTQNITHSPVAGEEPMRKHLAAGQDVFIAFPDTPCYLRPALVRDTILGTFPYATAVKVVAEQDGWVHVSGRGLEGWTERSHVTTQMTDVVPTFVAGSIYDADHPETLKLRTYIADEFGVAFLRLPALNCEYVWFQMIHHNTAFAWPPLRPRTPGRWSALLQPEPSVHISTVPITGCVMEYLDEQHVAQLWYVEAVTPDESLILWGFSGSDTGLFVNQTLSKDEWTQLQPRYIIKK